MSQNTWPLYESPFTHLTWPENHSVGLVLDGIAIEKLGEQIHQWAHGTPVHTECLYAGTRWEVVSELSPWLVWLNGPEDPVLEGFLKQGPIQEQGYLLVTAVDRATCTHWMRTHLQVEMAPGYEELVRLAHPALARAVIGQNLQRFPTRAVDQLVVPDCISQCWHLVDVPVVQSERTATDQPEKLIASPELEEAFEAFNRRKYCLQIWNSLDEPAREQLGPDLSSAYSSLRKILDQALGCGCGSLREVMQFLFASLPEQANTSSSAEQALTQHQG